VDTRPALPANTVLDGSYLITRVVGTGGFGITYEAEDIGLGIKVAIKEYFPSGFSERDASLSVHPRSGQDEQPFEWGRSNFLQEARTLASFEHPGIVRVSRVFEANSTAYMVMGFEQGQSFDAWLKELGRPPMQDELDCIVAPLLDVLETMHAADILHRDIAPDNIIIRPDGTPVLLDFGAARRAASETGRRFTNIVKAGYSPCEQYASDASRQGPWSDLYALGGTLYRAVTGKTPEEASSRIDEDRMPLAANSLEGAYRQEFLAAIDACLKVRHSERPQSVMELRGMMLSVPDEPPGTAPISERFEKVVALVTSAEFPLAATTAVLLVLGGLVGYHYVQRPHAAPVIIAIPSIEESAKADAEAARRQEERKAAEEKAAAERAREEAQRHAGATPPAREDKPSTPPPGKFDGVWEVIGAGGQGCRLKTWNYRLLISNNQIFVPGLPPGTISSTGEFNYKYVAVSWHKTPPGVFTGRLAADAGSGQYNYSGACLGSMKLKRI